MFSLICYLSVNLFVFVKIHHWLYWRRSLRNQKIKNTQTNTRYQFYFAHFPFQISMPNNTTVILEEIPLVMQSNCWNKKQITTMTFNHYGSYQPLQTKDKHLMIIWIHNQKIKTIYLQISSNIDYQLHRRKLSSMVHEATCNRDDKQICNTPSTLVCFKHMRLTFYYTVVSGWGKKCIAPRTSSLFKT